jgi:mannose-6-phosphate isomerase-like protein (cupin superfamily)
MDESILEIGEYDGEGYQPLVDFGDWRVAMLRYMDKLQAERLDSMERHTQTDEVFVLLDGEGTLVLGGNAPQVECLSLQVMQPGKVYNVKRNAWHTVCLSRGASLLLVENRDTGAHNSEFASLSPAQRQALLEKLNQSD